MANISIFKFNHANVRVQLLNGEPLFCLIDVAEILNLSKAASSRFRLNEKGVHKMYLLTNGGKQEIVFVDEPNLYRVIFRSNKKEAIQFQNWIFEEVLPSIRKTGSYSVAPAQQPYDANSLTGPDRVITHSDMMVIHTVIERALYLYGFWHQYEPAIRMLNSNIAASVHDCFLDASWSASRLADTLGIPVRPYDYFKKYPFHKDSFEKHQYYLAHSRV